MRLDQMNATDDQAATSTGVGSNMTPTHGVVLVIVSSAVALVVLGYIFRK